MRLQMQKNSKVLIQHVLYVLAHVQKTLQRSVCCTLAQTADCKSAKTAKHTKASITILCTSMHGLQRHLHSASHCSAPSAHSRSSNWVSQKFCPTQKFFL